MKKFLMTLVITSFVLTACSSGESEHTKEENMKRNDTSKHPTSIGNNKSY